MLKSLSDTINKYDNRSYTDELSIMRSDDAAVILDGKNAIQFEDLLTSKFVDENTVNDERVEANFERSEELRNLGFESDVTKIHNLFIDEHGYDAFVEKQREIFVEENENTINDNDFEAIFEADFIRSEEMRHLDFESDLTNIHNAFIEENGYDAFAEKQSEISDFKLNEFEDKMHDLDENLIKNNNSELKL